MKHFIVISAPSGSGKTTLCRALQNKIDGLNFSISWTTRPIRHYEMSGYDYNFISAEEFQNYISNDDFAEYQDVHGFMYGTPQSVLDDAIANGEMLLLELDVKGALKIKSRYPDDTISIFIMPPSIEALKERLRKRGADSEIRIGKRMERLEMELSFRDRFDYEVVNDDLDRALKELSKIIEKENKGVKYVS
ncbi:MAG: guanylate kinase [Candidatus Neomarinimicrobiota bacterium]